MYIWVWIKTLFIIIYKYITGNRKYVYMVKAPRCLIKSSLRGYLSGTLQISLISFEPQTVIIIMMYLPSWLSKAFWLIIVIKKWWVNFSFGNIILVFQCLKLNFNYFNHMYVWLWTCWTQCFSWFCSKNSITLWRMSQVDVSKAAGSVRLQLTPL